MVETNATHIGMVIDLNLGNKHKLIEKKNARHWMGFDPKQINMQDTKAED